MPDILRVCDRVLEPGGHLLLSPAEVLMVRGRSVVGAQIAGLEGRFERRRGAFLPEPKLQRALKRGEWTLVVHRRRAPAIKVQIEIRALSLPSRDVTALLEQLETLVASFEDPSVVDEVSIGRGHGPEARMRALHETLRLHVSTLLERPTTAPPDRAWLGGLIGAVQAFADRRLRSWTRLDGAPDPGSAFWRAARAEALGWRRRLGTNLQPSQGPSPALTRDPRGSAIVRAAQDADAGGRRALRHDLTRRPIDHGALYELWCLLQVVEVLRENFKFSFAEGEPQRVLDHATYDDRSRRWRFDTLRLVRAANGPDGAQLSLRATLRHKPTTRQKRGSPLRPTLSLVIQGEGLRTEHLLSARWTEQEPLALGDHVARDELLHGPRRTPTAAFVVLPTPRAELGRTMAHLDERYDARYPKDSVVSERPIYGVTWGTLYAGPHGGMGLRQFVTLALQYHRTELRHVCGQCGLATDLGHMDLPRGGALGVLLGAHHDRPEVGRAVSTRYLRYTCRDPECGYGWSRHACARGHVLMKHGALTPHCQRGEVDLNVVCSACGHFKA